MEQVNNTVKQNYNDYDTYLCDVILLLVNILNLFANLVIIYVIGRRKLWKTSAYFCILNWAILDILHLLTSPGIFRWYEKVDDIFHDYVSFRTHVCCSFAFQLGILLLLFILILQAKVKFFGKNYICLICIVWSLIISCILANIQNTLLDLYIIMFTTATYLILIIVLFIVCIAFFAQQSLSENDFRLILILVSTYVFVWLFVILILAVSLVVVFTLQPVIYEYPITFALALAESCPLMNAYILQKIDRRFRLYLSWEFCGDRKKEESTVSFVKEDKEEII